MNNYQIFFSTFFKDKTKYSEVQINGFIITQQIHGITGGPVYALYSRESFKNYKKFSQEKLL